MANIQPQNDYYKHICNSQTQMQMNQELYDRNIPSHMLQPYVSVRPVMTKYSKLPIIDPRVQPHIKLKQEQVYNTKEVFNPGNTQSPWSGFASNINVESSLRNQIYALQSSSKAVYVPESRSDLYQYNVQSTPVHQPFPYLFQQEKFNGFNPNPENLGKLTFNNNTRQQNKDLTGKQLKCNHT